MAVNGDQLVWGGARNVALVAGGHAYVPRGPVSRHIRPSCGAFSVNLDGGGDQKNTSVLALETLNHVKIHHNGLKWHTE